MNTNTQKCIYCHQRKVVKDGHRNRSQRWRCRSCGKRFVRHKEYGRQLMIDYVFHKQTMRELALVYNKDVRTLHTTLDGYVLPQKNHIPRAIHLLVDATYFGGRMNNTDWCAVVFRDNDTKENIWWTYDSAETKELYAQGKEYVECMGYTILSVTGDGFSGIRTSFLNTPFQMCHIHMERLVVKGTTRNPKLEAGQALLALVRTLHSDKTTEDIFRRRLLQYKDTYYDFLQEKSLSLTTGETWYTHDELRKAFNSLYRFFPYLFTYLKQPHIPRTTNSLEGHFSHVKAIIRIHRALSKERTQKVLSLIFLCSTIAPSEEFLKEVLP